MKAARGKCYCPPLCVFMTWQENKHEAPGFNINRHPLGLATQRVLQNVSILQGVGGQGLRVVLSSWEMPSTP